MSGLLKCMCAFFLMMFLVVLVYYFSGPDKGLVGGTPLRARIAVEELLGVFREGVEQGYVKVIAVPRDDWYQMGIVESVKIRQDVYAAYNKGSFLSYLSRARTIAAELVKSVQEHTASLDSAPSTERADQGPVNLRLYAAAVQAWVALNEKRLAVLQTVEGDPAEEQAKADVARLNQELEAVLAELEIKLAKTKYPKSRPLGQTARVAGDAQPAQLEGKREEKTDASAFPPVPPDVLTGFVQRYSNRDIRLTPYYFKNLKVLKSAATERPSLYCISFSADVYHKHDNKRWDRSPVVLNVIVSLSADSVMSTFENFAKNPWEYPRDGACVTPTWGVHEFQWEEVCPYKCMSRDDLTPK